MRGSLLRGIGMMLMAIILAAPAAASAQEGDEPYPPADVDATVQEACPPQEEAGETVACVFEGFAPNTEVTVEVQGVNFAREFTVRADAEGVVAVEFTVPCPAPVGSRVDVTVTGEGAEGGTRTVRTSFTVGGVARVCETPATGVNVTYGLLAAATAIAVGLLLVVGVRRRRHAGRSERVS